MADMDGFDRIQVRQAPRGGGRHKSRPWLGIHFICAGVYLRVYCNRFGTGYKATCPQCGKCMRFRVGRGGTGRRFFEVSC